MLLGERNTASICFVFQSFWFQLPPSAQLYPVKDQIWRREVIPNYYYVLSCLVQSLVQSLVKLRIVLVLL